MTKNRYTPKVARKTPEERAAAKEAMRQREAERKALVAAKKAAKKEGGLNAEVVQSAGEVPKSGNRTKAARKAPQPAPMTNGAAPAPTLTIATELQAAFAHFNRELYNGELPDVVLRLERLKRYKGYFRRQSWGDDGKSAGTHEIVLDPALFRERDIRETLSTLVHEQAHLRDFVAGTAPKKAWHGKSWCEIMVGVGLTPVILDSKGNRIDKATGPNATHEIVKGGAFDVSCAALLATGFAITWSAAPEPEKPEKGKKKRAGAKAKHTCPECGANAWGKPAMVLHCYGTKGEAHDPVEMECDRDDYEGSDGDEADEA